MQFSALLDGKLAGRTSRVEPATIVLLGGTPCDYARLRVRQPAPDAASDAHTLVKLSVGCTEAGPATPPRIWLSGAVFAELGIVNGAVLSAELVGASAVRPWVELRVSPHGLFEASAELSSELIGGSAWPSPLSLPTAAEVRFGLSVGVSAAQLHHPWRSDCRCRATLVRRETRLELRSRHSRVAPPGVAVGVAAPTAGAEEEWGLVSLTTPVRFVAPAPTARHEPAAAHAAPADPLLLVLLGLVQLAPGGGRAVGSSPTDAAAYK